MPNAPPRAGFSLAYPLWATAAYAVVLWGGLGAAIMLLLRN